MSKSQKKLKVSEHIGAILEGEVGKMRTRLYFKEIVLHFTIAKKTEGIGTLLADEADKMRTRL